MHFGSDFCKVADFCSLAFFVAIVDENACLHFFVAGGRVGNLPFLGPDPFLEVAVDPLNIGMQIFHPFATVSETCDRVFHRHSKIDHGNP